MAGDGGQRKEQKNKNGSQLSRGRQIKLRNEKATIHRAWVETSPCFSRRAKKSQALAIGKPSANERDRVIDSGERVSTPSCAALQL